jgi:hypothetical protein
VGSKNKKRRTVQAPVPAAPRSKAWSLDDVRRHWQSSVARLEHRLHQARRAGAAKWAFAREHRAALFGSLAFAIGRMVLIVTAPFVVLVRGAVWLYQRHGFTTWLALFAAGTGTLLLLTLYGAFLSRRFTGRARLGLMAKWVAAPLVVGYCGYALLYLSRVNAKAEAVRSVYTGTHPLLRVALATLILVDRNAVITDLSRVPDDYARMGLPVNQRSLHYQQSDGWVHAVDLRTQGAIKSVLVEWYFLAMGLDTLRHTGTGDHLHLSLPLAATK